MKLAEILKSEEAIWDIQNKLHSNGSALTAAWERVATKMNKSGKLFLFFILFMKIQFFSV